MRIGTPIGSSRYSRAIAGLRKRMQPCEGAPGDQPWLVGAVDPDHAAPGQSLSLE
jgi:hypothetical protein